MSHRCYYCDEIFKSREQLYDHVVIHAKIRNKNNQKINNTISEIKDKKLTKNKKISTQVKSKTPSKKPKKEINILEKIEQLQEKMESDIM